MRKLLGPHLGGQWIGNLEILRQWQPPFILLLQPEVEKVKQLRAACPDAVIIGRIFHDDSHYAINIESRPAEFAREIHQEIIGNPATPLLDYVQSNNETNQDWQGIQKLNIFTQEWMFLADQSQQYKCAILSFSVGNPDLPHKPGDPAGFDGRMLYWQQVLPTLNYAQQRNHLLLLHVYGYPDMFHPDADWYIYRYERQVQANLRTLGITNLKYAYGEIGIDRLIVGDKGGYKVSPATDHGYTNQLLQWEKDQQSQSLLLGGAIFTLGDSGGWGTYDIASTNVASMIAQHYANHAGEYKSPSDTGTSEPMQTHIPAVSKATNPVEPQLPPRQWDERLTQRGVTIETPPVAPGKDFWRVVKVQWYDEQQAGGRHHIFLEAIGKDGKPVAVALNVRWPTGSADAQTNGRSGFDAGNFPMSKSLNEFSVTVDNDDGLPSETVKGIGMGDKGNSGVHTSTRVIFQLATMPATQPQPTPQPEPGHPKIPYGSRIATTVTANLRAWSSLKAPIIREVPPGTVFDMIGYNDDWYQVPLGNGEGNGWFHESVVAQASQPPTPTPQPVGDNWARSLAFVRKWEGGWADDPNDPGGATNKGITLGTYTRWRLEHGQSAPTKDELRSLSDEEANRIYHDWYWVESRANTLSWPLCLAHFDTSVNAGPGRAQEILQKSDGDFLRYMGYLIDWYTRINNFEHFGRAWIRRRAALLLEAAKA